MCLLTAGCEMKSRSAVRVKLSVRAAVMKTLYFDHVAQQVNLTPHELTNLLWNEYSPSDIWMVILAIGLGTTLLLYIYDRVINKTKR